MRRFKIILTAVLATAAISAVVASSASAAAEVLGGPTTFAGTSGKGTLSTLGAIFQVTCTSSASEGELSNATEGTLHIHFKGCAAGGIACTGLGESEAGVILTLAATLLVEDSLSPLGAGILIKLSETVHFLCGSVLAEVKGQLICLVSAINTKSNKFTIVCEEVSAASGDPKELKYWEAGVEHNINASTEGLLTSQNHSTFKDSAENTSATVTTAKEVTIDA